MISTIRLAIRCMELSVKLPANPSRNATTPHAIPSVNIALGALFVISSIIDASDRLTLLLRASTQVLDRTIHD